MQNIPVALGDGYFDNLHVEHLETENSWQIKNDFPFGDSYFVEYSVISFSSEILVFGGEISPGAVSALTEEFTGAGPTTKTITVS